MDPQDSAGARLLDRTTRSAKATVAGKALYASSLASLKELERATETPSEGATQARGRLKVAVPTSFALTWRSVRVPKFLALAPDVHLELWLNDRFEDRFDCAIRIASAVPNSTLVVQRLGQVQRVPAQCRPPAHTVDGVVANRKSCQASQDRV